MRCVPLTSYGFLQTQPLASYALAIQIAFPSVGAAQASFSLTGLPASLGKQKSRAKNPASNNQSVSIKDDRQPHLPSPAQSGRHD
ncbi:hypothetical protein NX722_04895 [Endozoicomonas gorgoniicola]|uniref:Uncharacterized protein n=1 Tax=Endozoicomonas gorgoniicola TaxID=1234144 RepID=A0ABT3MRK0_9GAMM|nr:hypothetical protein [Endozoicomonas gorgoniicola]MCW7551987.1 hypothetical protein [Endozoicomonas gorgoniicola]